MQSIILPSNNFKTFNFGKNAPPGYVMNRTSSNFINFTEFDKYVFKIFSVKKIGNGPTSSSIFRSIEYAKDASIGSYALLKKMTALFFCSLTITIILLVLMAIPVTMIIIGSLYLKQCTFQIMIPIWLIVFGALSIVKNLSTLIQRIKA